MLSLYKKKSTKKTYKRKNGASSFSSRPWSRFNPRKALWTPSDPYSDSYVHKFRRLGGLIRLATSASDIPTLYSDAGPGNAAMTIGTAITDNIASITLEQFGLTYSAHLDSVLNYNDFTSLFNEYKIDKVDLEITLLNGPSGQPNIASILPMLYVRYDPNDQTMPSSFGDLAQSANVTEFSFSSKTTHHYSFVPKASVQVYAPAGLGFAAPSSSSMWFDTTGLSSSIDMYGLKMWVRNFVPTGGAGQIISFQPTFFLSMRRPR